MPNRKPRHFTLKMQFDGEQISDVLLYKFEHDGKDATTREGRYTGVIQFQEGDTVGVEVTMTATAGENAVENVEVMSLDLVSMPNVTHQIESFSPFIADEVTKSLKGCWSEPVKDTNKGVDRWITTWEGEPLTVVAEKGFWQLAGFLGVAVYEKRGIGDEVLSIVRIPRVLSFDPEAGSGTGGGPDPD